MPTTITAYNTFTANTKARASQVNANFDNHRGTLVPINSNTATASNLTHDLGSTEHRWRNGYVSEMYLGQTTSGYRIYDDATASGSLTFEKLTSSPTAGAIIFRLGGTTSARVLPTGFDGETVAPGTLPYTAHPTRAATTTAATGGIAISPTISAIGIVTTAAYALPSSTITISCTGQRPLWIGFIPAGIPSTFRGAANTTSALQVGVLVEIVQNGTSTAAVQTRVQFVPLNLTTTAVNSGANQIDMPASAVNGIIFPSAGNHTFYGTIRQGFTGASANAFTMRLCAYEL